MADVRPIRAMAVSDRVAAAVVILRRSRGMTREDLAARLSVSGLPGLSAAALTNIESRRVKGDRPTRLVTVDELVAFAEFFQVSIQDLVSGPAASLAVEVARLRAEADRLERCALVR